MSKRAARARIFETLERLHAAQANHDLDAMLEVYGPGYVDLAKLRTHFETRIARGAFRSRAVDLAACETFVWRDTALVKPVVYRSARGDRAASFHLQSGADGRWRIIDANRAHLPGEPVWTAERIRDAGRLIGNRGMLWTRRFDAPVEKVWQTVSTKEGLDAWWLTRAVEIDLRRGGRFEHHWTNTIRDLRVNAFIEFEGVPADASAAQNLMRFELRPDGDGTLFSFFDAFNAHPRPLSLPWTAAGWHGTIDALERALGGRDVRSDFGLGGDFYWAHLRDAHRFAAMAARLQRGGATPAAWRGAYLIDGL